MGNGRGCCIPGFQCKIHYISREELQKVNFVKYIAGVDWGYEHFGAIVLLGKDDKGCYYLIKEIARQYEEIDFWLEQAQAIKAEYGNIPFIVILPDRNM